MPSKWHWPKRTRPLLLVVLLGVGCSEKEELPPIPDPVATELTRTIPPIPSPLEADTKRVLIITKSVWVEPCEDGMSSRDWFLNGPVLLCINGQWVEETP